MLHTQWWTLYVGGLDRNCHSLRPALIIPYMPAPHCFNL